MKWFKRDIVLTVLLLLFATGGNGLNPDRRMLVGFDRFTESVKNIKIAGFPGNAMIEIPDEDEREYTAHFISGKDVLGIKLEVRYYSPISQDTKYIFNGYEADFAVMGQMAILIVDLPHLCTILTVLSNKIKDKPALERIAAETGIMELKPLMQSWPETIPSEYQLKGILLDNPVTKAVDGYTYMVTVRMIMGTELKSSLVHLASIYGDQEGFIQFPDGVILDYPSSEVNDIDDFHPENSIVEFYYYIP